MNLKKILFGEKVPDRDDPNYKKLREESEIAGRKAAEITGLGKILAKVQHFAENHQKVFLSIIFAYCFFASVIAIQRVHYLWNHRPQQSSAVERQERELGFKHLSTPTPEVQEGEGEEVADDNVQF
ncbi:MAG: hypothetical protein IKH58_10275 [Bacteroidales bacterium]|nr:hypothetical protein [Bacteroidales bacterium]